MELDNYLMELESCPDEHVSWNESWFHKKLGVYDNFNILISASFEEMPNYLLSFPGNKFMLKDSHGDKYKSFEYCPGTVVLQIQHLTWDKLGDGLLAYGCSNNQEHLARQINDFKSRLVLFPYQKEKKISGVLDDLKAIAIVIKEIAELAKSNKLSLCMPAAARYLDYPGYPSEDLSRIVYYYPNH
jgi:hypothetical protein